MPRHYERRAIRTQDALVAVILPTYAPSAMTSQLVEDLLRYNANLFVYVVDDATPSACSASLEVLRHIARISERVTVLRTSRNMLKAGALNVGLRAILSKYAIPDVILTVDDDVVIAEGTVATLVRELLGSTELGAVCSECRVHNKNKNLLTRLQGLEYLGFNAIRLADHGFLRGPLVMHGMLTAFRTTALRETGGFAEGHLIEDYEITSRLKARGWAVRHAVGAPAWTVVPESLGELWRQRTRWSYGGITVVTRSMHPSAVFQDLLGHAVFLSTVLMVLILILFRGSGAIPTGIAQWIIALSLAQFFVWYAFSLWLMRSYAERDVRDWLIRGAVIPEFIYGYVMTFALLGSYIFLLFNLVKRALMRTEHSVAHALADAGERAFGFFGYKERRWGTRALGI